MKPWAKATESENSGMGKEDGDDDEKIDKKQTSVNPCETPISLDDPPQIVELSNLQRNVNNEGGRFSATVAGMWMAVEERTEQGYINIDSTWTRTRVSGSATLFWLSRHVAGTNEWKETGVS